MFKILYLLLLTSCFNRFLPFKVSVKATPDAQKELSSEQQEAISYYYRTPNVKTIEVLLKVGVSPNYLFADMPLLTTAIIYKQVKSVRLLLEHKDIDVNMSKSSMDKSYKKTALHYALEIKNKNERNKIVEMLLQHEDIYVNKRSGKQNLTPLMILANSGSRTLTKLLLEKGANTQLEDDKGKRAIDYARENKFENIKIEIDEKKYKIYEAKEKQKKEEFYKLLRDSSRSKEKYNELFEEVREAYNESIIEEKIIDQIKYDKYNEIEQLLLNTEGTQLYDEDFPILEKNI